MCAEWWTSDEHGERRRTLGDVQLSLSVSDKIASEKRAHTHTHTHTHTHVCAHARAREVVKRCGCVFFTLHCDCETK